MKKSSRANYKALLEGYFSHLFNYDRPRKVLEKNILEDMFDIGTQLKLPFE